MKSLLQFIFLLTGFLPVNVLYCAGTDTLQLAQDANTLFLSGDFYKAGIYYQKAAFFHNGNQQKTGLYLKAAESYKLLGKYKEALEILSPLNVEGLNNQSVYNIKYQCALLAYLDGNFTGAETYLLQIRYLLNNDDIVYGSYLLYVLALNEMYRWDEAATMLAGLNTFINRQTPLTLQQVKATLDSLYIKTRIPRLKNVEKASRLSTFIPGSGQVYAGYAGEGLFSFTAIAVIATGMVVGVVYQYYFSSILLGNILIDKFYKGGIKRTEFLTEKRNYLKTRHFNRELRIHLIKLFGNQV